MVFHMDGENTEMVIVLHPTIGSVNESKCHIKGLILFDQIIALLETGILYIQMFWVCCDKK